MENFFRPLDVKNVHGFLGHLRLSLSPWEVSMILCASARSYVRWRHCFCPSSRACPNHHRRQLLSNAAMIARRFAAQRRPDCDRACRKTSVDWQIFRLHNSLSLTYLNSCLWHNIHRELPSSLSTSSFRYVHCERKEKANQVDWYDTCLNIEMLQDRLLRHKEGNKSPKNALSSKTML